jgi:hypothetical protein
MAEIINKVTSLASAFASKEFPKPGDFVRHLALVKNSENSNPDGIQQQSTILVPYDCDRNFEPCTINLSFLFRKIF